MGTLPGWEDGPRGMFPPLWGPTGVPGPDPWDDPCGELEPGPVLIVMPWEEGGPPPMLGPMDIPDIEDMGLDIPDMEDIVFMGPDMEE